MIERGNAIKEVGGGTVSLTDSRYPRLLKQAKDAPKVLYYKGNWDDVFSVQGGENCLAVVGSRRMTSYGKRVTEQLVGELARAGITIVSGFMYGVDATAHKAAVLAGGKTIAVMPCGIDVIHPAYQADLYERILKTGGLIVSEWEGSRSAMTWTFPRRNRIVAGLCKGTLVIEASSESGALITANFAKAYKRKVYAVPGPITSGVSQGTLQLLKDGAKLVSDASDVLKEYEIFLRKDARREMPGKAEVSELERAILLELQVEALELDVVARNLGLPAGSVGTAVSLLELRGMVKKEGEKYCAANDK